MPYTAQGLWFPDLDLTTPNNPPADFQKMAGTIQSAYGQAVANWAGLAAVTPVFPGMGVWVTSLGGVAVYNGSKWIAPAYDVVKSADEDRTSTTTISSDGHLLYSVPANGDYFFELDLMVGSAISAAGDIKLGFIFPTSTYLNFRGIGADIGLAGGTVQTGQWQYVHGAASGVTTLSFGASATTSTGILIRGLITGVTASSNLRLQWAQDSTNPQKSTIYAGSWMRVKHFA